MKNIKKILLLALVFSFTTTLTTSCAPKTYKKGKKTKKRGCNCPHFSADVINWNEATKLTS